MPPAETIEFTGSLYRIGSDRDGEAKVTFAVPLSDLKQVLRIGEWVHQTLLVCITKV